MPTLEQEITFTFICAYCGHENEVECPGTPHRSYLRCGHCDREQPERKDLACGRPLHQWYRDDGHWVQGY